MLRVLLLLMFLPVFPAAGQPNARDAESHARQSYTLAQKQQLPEAEAEMREAIRLEPRNALYHSGLAGLLVQAGNLTDARTELQKGLALKPAPAVEAQLANRLKEVELKLGAQLGRTGHDREGFQLAASAAQRFPNDARVLQMLGYFQSRLGQHADAVRSYAQAQRLDSSSPEINLGLAASQYSAGQEDDSLRTLEAGIVRFPQDAMHYQALGVVLLELFEKGRDTKEQARKMFEKALDLDSALSESNYQLGRIELDAGEINAAQRHLLTAEKAAPNDSRVHFVLARLYRKQGNSAGAEREMKAFRAAKTVQGPKR
jgi:Flp pilus assembly protein TadD